MTTTEFKKVIEQFHEHLYHKMPSGMRRMELIDMARGMRIILSARKESDGIGLIWQRTAEIQNDKLTEGLGSLIDGLLSLAHYGNLSVENGDEFPFTYASCVAGVRDEWFLDFGNGVEIPAHRLRISESRTSRVLADLKTPWPEWRCAPGYPTKLKGVFGWDARHAEAAAERSARACYKMLAASYGRLNVHSDRGAVQAPGRGYEPSQDHDSQLWPQCEL